MCISVFTDHSMLFRFSGLLEGLEIFFLLEYIMIRLSGGSLPVVLAFHLISYFCVFYLRFFLEIDITVDVFVLFFIY